MGRNEKKIESTALQQFPAQKILTGTGTSNSKMKIGNSSAIK
jgi:hypothetical protein